MLTGPRVPPAVGLVVAVAAVSGGAILVRLSDAPSSVAAFYRVLFTTLPLVPVALWRYRTQLARVTRRDLGFATLSGVALALHFAAWFESLAWTSVAASVTLVQAQPVFVALGAWLLLRERVTSRMIVGIAVRPGLLGHTVINWTLAHLESSVVSVSLLGEPIGATLLAFVFLAEAPTALTLVGGVVVLAGISLTATESEA
ncbi:DMT family transporter [Halorubrum salsamenti]|uniref:DMT family transporter n=1 Tax=Halorubrum salsamenti TaxID=2583990 RepID=UPI0011A41BC7|nr:DMT family transporter [Halorubrum salsamenti]